MDFPERRLRFLHEAQRHGSMRAASESLDVAPSSISRQIAALERDLGLPIFERGRRTLKLTDAGQLLVDHYRERNRQYESLRVSLDDLRNMRTGEVKIAIGQGLVNAVLANVLVEYRRAWPGVRVEVSEVATQQVLSLLREDEVHFGIVLRPPADPGLLTRFSIPQALHAVMRADHRLAARASVGLRELQDLDLVLPTPNFRSRQLLDEIAARDGLRLRGVVTVNSIHMLLACIRAGAGIGLLPPIHVHDDPGAESLARVPIEHPALSVFDIHAMVRVGRTLPRSTSLLLDMLQRELRRRPGGGRGTVRRPRPG